MGGGLSQASYANMFPASAYAGQPPMGAPMGGMGMPMGQPMPYMTGPNGAPMGPAGGIHQASYYAGAGGEAPKGCASCNGFGCDNCMGDRGFDEGMGFLRRMIGPYPGGGWCAPRWFDFHAEGVALSREDVSRTVNFMSDAPAGMAPPVIVLSTDQMEFDEEYGFRASAAFQFLPGGAFEVSYLGQLNWQDTVSVVPPEPLIDPDSLYSAFSNYGTNPPPMPPDRGGFTDTDSAEWADINYSSSIDTIEVNYRKRFILPNCRFQGSWIMGVRYFKLDEQFLHRIVVNYTGGGGPVTGFMNYGVATSNSMTGFQVGGDGWATLIPGVRMGGDVKIGLFGNNSSQHTTINALTLPGTITETFGTQGVSFIAEGNATVLWKINQNWTFRAGYMGLFADGVALAPENVNFTPPFGGGAARTPFVNNNGDVFVHGGTAGLEWMW